MIVVMSLVNAFSLVNVDQDNIYTSHRSATNVIMNNKNSRYKKRTITHDLEEIQC